MGFDDLEAAEREHSDRETDDEQASEEHQSVQPNDEASTSPTGTDETGASGSSSGDDDGGGGVVADEPGFAFGDVKQSPMYARPEAWAALEDALDLEVVRELRESGVRNEAKRELHDAALRVAAEHPEEIAEAVREARRED